MNNGVFIMPPSLIENIHYYNKFLFSKSDRVNMTDTALFPDPSPLPLMITQDAGLIKNKKI